jgi:hypothetical protein
LRDRHRSDTSNQRLQAWLSHGFNARSLFSRQKLTSQGLRP